MKGSPRAGTLLLGAFVALAIVACGERDVPAGSAVDVPTETSSAPAESTEEPAERPTATESVSVTEPTEAMDVAGSCPSPEDDEQLVQWDSAGVCFLVPAEYEWEYLTDASLIVRAPSTVEGHEERMLLDVEPAAGRSAEEAANGLLAIYGLPAGSEGTPAPAPAPVTVGGREGYWIGGLPGQDINRRLVVVVDDRLYSAMFVPDDPERGDAYEQMEDVYGRFVDSAVFLPVEELPGE